MNNKTNPQNYRDSILRWQLPREGSLFHQLLEFIPFAESRLRELIELGAVYINEKRLISLDEAQLSFAANTSIRIHSEPRRCSIRDINWTNQIYLENSSFLLINKPAGLPAHPMVDNWQENALIQLEKFKNSKLFLTHRLDRPTEGLMLIAKTPEFQREFNQMLLRSEVEKYYRAEVERPISSKLPVELRHWMLRSLRAPKQLLSEAPTSTKADECRLEIQSQNKNRLEIKLHTGRTHQIRAQLGFIKSPIVGDQIYGASLVLPGDQIHLQSANLTFTDPTSKKRVDLSLPPPAWFTESASKLSH